MSRHQNPATPTTIYALKDSSGSVFYIGQSMDLPRRLESHRRAATERRWPTFTADTLEVVSNNEADTAEKRHILAALEAGAKLVNWQQPSATATGTTANISFAYSKPPRLIVKCKNQTASRVWKWDMPKYQEWVIADLTKFLTSQGVPGMEPMIRHRVGLAAKILKKEWPPYINSSLTTTKEQQTMTDFCDAGDYTNEEVTEEEREEATSAAEAIISAEFDSQHARCAWETMLETQEGDGYLHLT